MRHFIKVWARGVKGKRARISHISLNPMQLPSRGQGTEGPWAGDFASAICGSPNIYAKAGRGRTQAEDDCAIEWDTLKFAPLS